MKLTAALLAFLALAGTSSGTHAQHSPLPDEAEVLDKNDCEVGLAYEHQTQRREPTEHERSISLACGIGWRTELALGFSRLRSDGTSSKTIGFEGRTSLPVAGPGKVTWALVYGLEAERAVSGGWHRSEQYAALEAILGLERGWLLEATLGSARDLPSRSSSTPWMLAVEREIANDVEVRAELNGDDHGRPMLGLELRHANLFEDAEISLSAGTRGGRSRERRFGLGISFEF